MLENDWRQYLGVISLLILALFAIAGTSIALGALALMLIAALADSRRLGLVLARSPIAWVALALAMYVLARGLIAAWYQPATAVAQYTGLWHWLLLFFFPLVAWFSYGSRKRILLVLAVALIGLLIGIALKTSWQHFVKWVIFHSSRADFGLTFLGAALYVGVALLGWVAFADRLMGPGRCRGLRVAVWMIFAIILVEMLVLTQSRAVILSLLVMLPVLTLVKVARLPSRAARKPACGVFLCLVLAALVLGFIRRAPVAHRVNQTLATLEQASKLKLGDVSKSSLGARVHLYNFGIKTWLQRPVWGWGTGMEATQMLSSAPISPQTHEDFAHLHDGYLEVLVRFGVVGLALAGFLAALFVQGLYRGWRRNAIPEDIALFFGAAGLLAALTNLSDFRVIHEYYRYFTILLLGLMYGYVLNGSGHTFQPDKTR